MKYISVGAGDTKWKTTKHEIEIAMRLPGKYFTDTHFINVLINWNGGGSIFYDVFRNRSSLNNL